jgi:hypothetical protein
VVHGLAVLPRIANERLFASHGSRIGDSSDTFHAARFDPLTSEPSARRDLSPTAWGNRESCGSLRPPYLRAFGSQGPFPHCGFFLFPRCAGERSLPAERSGAGR